LTRREGVTNDPQTTPRSEDEPIHLNNLTKRDDLPTSLSEKIDVTDSENESDLEEPNDDI